jgi:hypothetical protein
MISFLWWSFVDYEQSAPGRSSGSTLVRVASWLNDTALFEQAWTIVCDGPLRWWWSEQLCLFTVGFWTIFLLTTGAYIPLYRPMALLLLFFTSRPGARCETCVGVYALRTTRSHFSGQQLVLPCASSQIRDEAAGLHAGDSPTGVMAERARIAPDCLPSAALAAARLLSLEPAHHARAPGHPSPPSSHECAGWSPAHSHTDAVPAYHAAGRYRTAADGLIDDDRTEHAVGCAEIAPGAGVDWVGCRVDDHQLSAVGSATHAGWSADDDFGDGGVVDRFIGAVWYVLCCINRGYKNKEIK